MHLVITPPLSIRKLGNDKVVLTAKFVDGIREYLRSWRGSITVVASESNKPSGNLDDREYDVKDLGFGLDITTVAPGNIPDSIRKASIVLATLDYRQDFLSEACHQLNVPLVFVAEYTLNTRLQAVDAKTWGIMRLRRHIWEYQCEKAHIKAIKKAKGVQCNGFPTFDAYRGLNPNVIVYLDTRVRNDSIATDESVLKRGKPAKIRLVFSGRLVVEKGSDHLVGVANELRKLGLDYQFTICGAGRAESKMKRDIEKLGLGGFMNFAGVLDFNSQLIPFVRDQTDLFVCCHVQGDPSCTYVETMSCGVPIAGYDNEAFKRLVEYSQCGWTATMNRPELLAKVITNIVADRSELQRHSLLALQFARKHTFERTFEARVEHLTHLAKKG